MSIPANGLENDTIAAIATPPGKGGVGIVRISGPRSKTILNQIVGKNIEPRYATLCQFSDQNAVEIDSGLSLFFPTPNSFTGEDVVELQGHGGPVVMDLLLQACLAAGARMANPGEFSERAFLNDKLDLVQAEAVSDLINSASVNAARAAAKSLSGAFSIEVSRLASRITALRVYVEASIDFPEEEIDFLTEGQVVRKAKEILKDLETLLLTSKQGVLLKDGIRVVLVGKPNVGKSSLLNQLLGYDRAIVTEQAGTTRDALSEQLSLKGMPVTIVDTAGLRQTQDIVEQQGIGRTREEMALADCTLLVRDLSVATAGLSKELEELDEYRRPNDRTGQLEPSLLIVNNKVDLLSESAEPAEISSFQSVNVSALTGQGIDGLVDKITEIVGFEEQSSGFIARRRHVESLLGVKKAIQVGIEQINHQAAGELFAEDLGRAHKCCGDILGQMSSDELLGEIFSSFCIGK